MIINSFKERQNHLDTAILRAGVKDGNKWSVLTNNALMLARNNGAVLRLGKTVKRDITEELIEKLLKIRKHPPGGKVYGFWVSFFTSLVAPNKQAKNSRALSLSLKQMGVINRRVKQIDGKTKGENKWQSQ
jgi:hypothetical protein